MKEQKENKEKRQNLINEIFDSVFDEPFVQKRQTKKKKRKKTKPPPN